MYRKILLCALLVLGGCSSKPGGIGIGYAWSGKAEVTYQGDLPNVLNNLLQDVGLTTCKAGAYYFGGTFYQHKVILLDTLRITSKGAKRKTEVTVTKLCTNLHPCEPLIAARHGMLKLSGDQRKFLSWACDQMPDKF